MQPAELSSTAAGSSNRARAAPGLRRGRPPRRRARGEVRARREVRDRHRSEHVGERVPRQLHRGRIAVGSADADGRRVEPHALESGQQVRRHRAHGLLRRRSVAEQAARVAQGAGAEDPRIRRRLEERGLLQPDVVPDAGDERRAGEHGLGRALLELWRGNSGRRRSTSMPTSSGIFEPLPRPVPR